MTKLEPKGNKCVKTVEEKGLWYKNHNPLRLGRNGIPSLPFPGALLETIGCYSQDVMAISGCSILEVSFKSLLFELLSLTF